MHVNTPEICWNAAFIHQSPGYRRPQPALSWAGRENIVLWLLKGNKNICSSIHPVTAPWVPPHECTVLLVPVGHVPTSAMATPGTSLQGGPSSCTGQVTSHGTPWCTPGCDDKSFEGWPQGSLEPSLSLFFCSLGTVKPVKMPGRPGSQLIHTFKAAPGPPDISALGWIA